MNLTQIHRQRDSKFLSILDRIRRGRSLQIFLATVVLVAYGTRKFNSLCLLLLDGMINEDGGKILLENKSGITDGAIQLHARRDEV